MTTPPSRFPGTRAAEGEVLRVVTLLGADGEEEAEVLAPGWQPAEGMIGTFITSEGESLINP